uniref:ARAD1A10142p n=1 Tax=Blastobotrys adeninivorans TaxID=409370 RepID=A0A060T3J2_BLAAD
MSVDFEMSDDSFLTGLQPPNANRLGEPVHPNSHPIDVDSDIDIHFTDSELERIMHPQTPDKASGANGINILSPHIPTPEVNRHFKDFSFAPDHDPSIELGRGARVRNLSANYSRQPSLASIHEEHNGSPHNSIPSAPTTHKETVHDYVNGVPTQSAKPTNGSFIVPSEYRDEDDLFRDLNLKRPQKYASTKTQEQAPAPNRKSRIPHHLANVTDAESLFASESDGRRQKPSRHKGLVSVPMDADDKALFVALRSFQDRIAELEKERDEARKKLQSHQRDRESLQNANKQIDTQAAKLEKYRQIIRKLHKASTEAQEATSKAQKLEQDLEQANQKEKSMSEQLEDQSNKQKELDQQLQQAHDEITKLSTQLEEREKIHAKTEEELKDAKDQISQLTAQLQEKDNKPAPNQASTQPDPQSIHQHTQSSAPTSQLNNQDQSDPIASLQKAVEQLKLSWSQQHGHQAENTTQQNINAQTENAPSKATEQSETAYLYSALSLVRDVLLQILNRMEGPDNGPSFSSPPTNTRQTKQPASNDLLIQTLQNTLDQLLTANKTSSSSAQRDQDNESRPATSDQQFRSHGRRSTATARLSSRFRNSARPRCDACPQGFPSYHNPFDEPTVRELDPKSALETIRNSITKELEDIKTRFKSLSADYDSQNPSKQVGERKKLAFDIKELVDKLEQKQDEMYALFDYVSATQGKEHAQALLDLDTDMPTIDCDPLGGHSWM